MMNAELDERSLFIGARSAFGEKGLVFNHISRNLWYKTAAAGLRRKDEGGRVCGPQRGRFDLAPPALRILSFRSAFCLLPSALNS